MSLRVTNEGILTTVQDLGRSGYRKLGINPGGVMDRAAARLINILLVNRENEAMLECHFPAGEFLFNDDTVMALGGADFGAELDGKSVELWRTIPVRKGSVLRASHKRRGNRMYLSVHGGFAVDEWLGSSSTNLVAGAGGFRGRRLVNGDQIEFKTDKKGTHVANTKISDSLVPAYNNFPTIRIIPGAEFDILPASGLKILESKSFMISPESNRMGFRLQGAKLDALDEHQLISSAVNFGTVQLLPDGQMIILMADHQTTGGYPRIAHVAEIDLPLLAQLGPSDKLRFQVITLREAEAMSEAFERELAFLRMGCRLHSSNTRKV